jgi:hypothetical protein
MRSLCESRQGHRVYEKAQQRKAIRTDVVQEIVAGPV